MNSTYSVPGTVLSGKPVYEYCVWGWCNVTSMDLSWAQLQSIHWCYFSCLIFMMTLK